MLRRLVLAALALVILSDSRADTDVWLNVGGVSVHDQAGRNGNNWGAGLEARTSPELAFGAGFFRNSERQRTRYAGVIYTPWNVTTPAGPVFIGVQAGVVDGYPFNGGKPTPAAAPLAELRTRNWAVALSFIPAVERAKNANTIAVQFKWRIGGL